MINVTRRPKKYFSPLRYPGGKASLTDFLSEIIKTNRLSDITYVEPFAGGAGAALSLLLLERVDRIVINDFDKAIYYLWHFLVNESERFIDRILSVAVNIEEWHRQKEIYQSQNPDSFDLGFATFFLNRTNRSGIIEGGAIGGLEQKGEWGVNARFNKKELIRRIENISLYKNRIDVRNDDAIDLLHTLRDKKDVIIYLDPPYYVKGASLYLNHYQHDDHKRLSNFLNKYSYLNWVLTYDNVPQIASLYSDRKAYNFSLNYSAFKSKKGKEILVLSDTLEFPS